MQLLNKPNRWMAGFTLAALSFTADAVGFTHASNAATIGHTLDFVVQVRTDGSAPVECVGAEVSYGDKRLPAASVRVVVEPTGPETARLRVLSPSVVDEPVVNVAVSVGCNSRMSRRYVVFAEPPGYAAAAPVPMVLPQAVQSSTATNIPAAATEPMAGDASGPSPRETSRVDGVMTESGAQRTRGQALSDWGAGDARARRAGAAPVPARRLASTVRVAPRSAPALRPEPVLGLPSERVASALVANTAEAQSSAAAGSRLRLDVGQAAATTTAAPAQAPTAAEGDAVSRALVAVALAASSAREAAAAASASAARIANLETTIERLRKEAKASGEANEQLKLRLRDATGPGVWFWPLVILSVVLAATAAWLARRVVALQNRREETWVKKALPAAATADAAAGAAIKAELEPKFLTADTASPQLAGASSVGGKARVASAWPPPAPITLQPDPWVHSDLTVTRPLQEPGGSNALAHGSGRAADLAFAAGPDSLGTFPTNKGQTPAFGNTLFHDEEAPRDVSIEELIDLEQQAEFFVVLGQDRSAIELLVEHLRSTGGGSPLPYLKLLEIYRRVGDHDDYERTRDRFNHRFNAYAPHWGADLTTGRSLGAYPGVIPRLEQVWAKPVDAMAELEALLFRKSRGELFDLPAYREVLFLYSIARDLLDREGTDSLEVDFLLPMPDGADFGVTAPLPLSDADTLRQSLSPEDLPTSPAGFDATARERPRSIFDPMGEDTRFPSTRR